MTEREADVLPDIVARHADGAAFLWHLRDAAVRSPACDLEALCKLDERLDGHLDGLRIAGDFGRRACASGLAGGAAGEVFAAALLALERADVMAFAEVLGRGVSSPDLGRGIVSALGWTPFEQVKPLLDGLVAGDSPAELHCFGIAGFAAHRQDPGELLARAARAGEVRLRARALRAIGELGRVALLPELRRGLDADEPTCQFWAAWSAALFGDPPAAEALFRLACERGPFAERAFCMAVRRGDPVIARARVKELAQLPGALRIALAGAAALGDPALVPWVIDCMTIPEQARFAGWVMKMITGVDLAAESLAGAPPPGSQSGPSDDPRDFNVAPDPDARLPWPDPAAVQAWWGRARDELPQGVRLLLGRAIDLAWSLQVLQSGSQPARAAAALEVASLLKGRPLFEVRGPGFRQARALSEMRKSH